MKRERMLLDFFLAGSLVCALAISAFAQSAKTGGPDQSSHQHDHSVPAKKEDPQFLGIGDGIETCPVMGSPVDKNLKFEWKNQTYYACCEECLETIKKSPELYLKPRKKESGENQEKRDQAKPAGESKFLGKGDGIETCPVTGEPVEKNVKAEIGGRTVYACCPPCLDTIKKNPDLYLKKQ